MIDSSFTSKRVLFGLVALLCLGFSAINVYPKPPEQTEFKLENGMQVILLHVEDCKYFAAISFLPLGLGNDGADNTQWSHMIEHLTLRTTGVITDYRKLNAETLASGMHLDFIDSAENWKQGLDYQAKWLSGKEFAKDILEEELPKALGEIATTDINMFTHKWAFAAWNQIYRHGKKEVSMRRDLESATVEPLQAYRDRHLVLPGKTVLCVISGIETKELKHEITERFSKIQKNENVLPASTAEVDEEETPGNFEAHWDLKTAHYMEWFAMPATLNKDFAALYIASIQLNQSLMRDTELKAFTGSAFCGIDLVTPEKRYFYITASLKDSASAEKVQNTIARLRQKLIPNLITFKMRNSNLASQLEAPMDLDKVLRYKPANVDESLMIGNLALQWGMLAFQFQGQQSKLAKALKTITQDEFKKSIKDFLHDEQRNSLLLTSKP